MNHHCYALLDDAGADAANTAAARSRLYTGHVATLRCDDAAGWPALLEQMTQALARGRHAVTLCAYELGAALQDMATPVLDASGDPRPLAEILLFDQCVHLTRDEVDAWLASQVAGENDGAGAAAPAGIARVRADVDAAQFGAALARIHHYIEAGDTYQVNYTYRLRFDAFGSPPALYARLRARQPVPYGALIVLPDGGAVLSLSPELFVRHANGELTARPMKGTAPAAASGGEKGARGDDDADNAERAATLAADTKNRAENLMIVDLLRNDMGRIAVTGTVAVPALFDVRRYGSVLQMTSTVTARLRDDATLADIFAALYPCGSITGAPKRRSMEIIAELEAAARGIYTGAIGWFDASDDSRTVGDFCLSVPIRTLALQPPAGGVRRGQLGVGAGIVFDSDAGEEYAECRLKARFLTGLSNDFELFETMYASGDGVRHLDRHLKRLAASADYFGFPFDEGLLRRALDQTCAALPATGAHRLRLALDRQGGHTLAHAPLVTLDGPVTLLLAETPTHHDDLFLRHKSTQRARYDAGWRHAESRGAFDTVFFNERGELTEGGRSNVFVKLDGRWFTPPLSSGLLPGVMRAVLLADQAWLASERAMTLADLQRAEAVVVCNALRGALPAMIIT
jgi:para-aminobenzoate synthetase/4-amino-4-deoxychorismate lyase